MNMRLRELREAAGLTQDELADRCQDVDQGTISRLETQDDANPTWRVLTSLGRVLKCRPEEIMCAPPRHKVAR